MDTRSEKSSQIVASLAQRAGDTADIAKVAQTVVSLLQDLDASLTPIIGQQGVAALYRRSLHLGTAAHPSLAGINDRMPPTLDLDAIASVLIEQRAADALLFGEVLLTTLYELLTTLIGPSLTARLLHSAWASSSSPLPSQEDSP